MIKPLSLIPSVKEQFSQEYDNLCSPPLRKRADSLVFSITSEKFFSPKDTMLIESKQHEVSRQIQTLQLKIENLESRVERIDSEPCQENVFIPNKIKGYETNVYAHQQFDPFASGKENRFLNTTKIGKIVKKEKDLNKTDKLNISNQRKQKIHHFTTNSRQSIASDESELLTKIKELSQMRREVSAMKQSMEKTQRCKSICSDRLSASKDKIKSLKKEEKKQHRIIQRLRADLKKSENIRDKQKQVIQKQQEELNYYRQVFKLHKRLR